MLRPRSLVWLVMPQAALTRQVLEVNSLEWDSETKKEHSYLYSVQTAGKSLFPLEVTAKTALSVEVKLTKNDAKSDGTEPTKRKGMTKLPPKIITGEVEGHPNITKSLHTAGTEKCALNAEKKLFSYTTKMVTGITTLSKIYSLYANAAIKLLFTTAQITYQKKLYSSQNSVQSAEYSSNQQDQEVQSAMIVYQLGSSNGENKNFEQRYSQSHWKQWNYLLNYGKGEKLLSHELKFHEKFGPEVRRRLARTRPGSNEEYIEDAIDRKARLEARKVINKYFENIPGVKNFIDITHFEAANSKYVESIIGRRRWLRQIMDREEQLEHERLAIEDGGRACWCARCRDSRAGDRRSVNTRIQMSAADVTMVAMINIDKDPYLSSTKMLFQVHDEINLEAPIEYAEESAERVQYHMENTGLPLAVRLKAEPAMGSNWVEAH